MYENYCKLRDAKGLKDADVAKGTGITKSTFSDWKNGRSAPKNEKMIKIANFLGVSVEYLTTGEQKEGDPKYYLDEEAADIAQEIYENKDLRLLFDASRNAKPEDLKLAHDMLLALKRKENGEIE